jgi:cyclophilin family peptidyl-prolyl cis-trans isomerase
MAMTLQPPASLARSTRPATSHQPPATSHQPPSTKQLEAIGENRNTLISSHYFETMDHQQTYIHSRSHASLDESLDGRRTTDSYYWSPRSKGESKDSDGSDSRSAASSNPQSGVLADDRGHVKNTLVFTAKKRKSTISVVMLAFSILGFCMHYSSRSTLKLALQQGDRLVAFSARMQREIKSAQRNIRRLERELAALDAMEQKEEDLDEEKKVMDQAAMFTNPKVIEEVGVIQEKLKQAGELAEKLKGQVSELSKRDAIEKYGPGPHRVEIELIFPGHLSGPTKFVVEMAPIDIMPHSVFTFLEMASLELLNGCSFILNAVHVIKEAPLPYDGSPAFDKKEAFEESGLESVAFREYSDDYPHKPYTLGFAADGTPSFYINTEDNTQIHVGDPCFAKVVSGLQTVKRLETSPTRNGIFFENRIGIKSAVVLK